MEGNRHHARITSRQHPRWITRATAQDGRRVTSVNQTRVPPQVPPLKDDKAGDKMRKQLPTTKVEVEALKNGPEVANLESHRLRTRGPKVLRTSRFPCTGLTAQTRRRSSTGVWAMVLQAWQIDTLPTRRPREQRIPHGARAPKEGRVPNCQSRLSQSSSRPPFPTYLSLAGAQMANAPVENIRHRTHGAPNIKEVRATTMP